MMPFADSFYSDIDTINARSVYPTAPGATTASDASPMTDTTTKTSSSSDSPNGAGTVTSGNKGIFYWLGLFGLIIVLVFAARKVGGNEEFRNIKPTLYNFLAITLTAIFGIVGLKVIFTKFHVPGASDVILAA